MGQFRSRQRAICEVAIALALTAGCQPKDSNSDLQTFLGPSPTGFLPESPYTLKGTVTESGTGRPVADVRVDVAGRTTLTNDSGFYEFPGIGRSEVSFSKDGFEGPGPFFAAMSRPTTIDAHMQRIIRVVPPQALAATLFADDPLFRVIGHLLGQWECGEPCKLIRVAVPRSGRLRARVSWQPSGGEFLLWVTQRIGPTDPEIAWYGASGDLTAERPVIAGTDAFVYFGLNAQGEPGVSIDVPFKLTTSIAP
jgi:hypothetical protein